MRIIPIVLCCTVSLACGRVDIPRDTTQAVTSPGQEGLVFAEVPGALATRTEAQDYLDRARADLVAGDLTMAAEALSAAAPILREHAEMPISAAKPELLVLADSLDRIATALKTRTVPGLRALDALIARINLAEALHHRSLADFAWSKNEAKTTGEELIMAADHLDRAARAGRRPSRALKATVISVLDVGGRMSTGKSFQDSEVDVSLRQLAKAIQEQP